MEIRYREALADDFEPVMKVRMAVLENKLANPAAVQQSDYQEMIGDKGKGWVCEVDNKLVGFSIVDLKQSNIWALFVDPSYTRLGIGHELHRIMIDWAFGQGLPELWLGTDPKTRAEKFYYARGWKKVGNFENGEVHLTLSLVDWETNSSRS